MDLKRDKRQNIQKKLDFSSEPTGEARQAGREETESRQAMHEPESPANTIRLMEEICERGNLLEALRRGEGRKRSARSGGGGVCQHTVYTKGQRGTTQEKTINRAYPHHTARRGEMEKAGGAGG